MQEENMSQNSGVLTTEETFAVASRGKKVLSASTAASATPYRVLVVDDEPSLTEMIRAYLHQGHLEVDSAPDGRRAQKMLEGKKYDLVLSDIRMPRLDGMELLQWIRQQRPSTEVILMTGELPGEAVDEAKRHGATDFLAKPFSAEQMRAAIERCRQRRQAANAREVSLANLLLKPLIHEMSAGLENAVTMLKMMQRSAPKNDGEERNTNLDATIVNLFRLMGLTEEYCKIAFSLDEGEEVHADRFDLEVDIFEKVLEDCKFDLKRKKIEVVQKRDRHTAFEPKPLTGNRVLLRSVFRALIGTAIRYSDDAGTISYRMEKNEHDYKVHISHKGNPFPADISQPTRGEGNGMGYSNGGLEFGLSMAESILRHYGGSLSCEPCRGGSRFTVALPQ